MSWANIVITKFFDEQKKRQGDTKLSTLTSKKEPIGESGLFGKNGNRKDLTKQGGNSNGGGWLSSSLAALFGSTVIKSLLKKLVDRLIPKPIRNLIARVKGFKTRLIRRLTPKPIRNLLARVKMARRQISRALKPKNLFKAAKTALKSGVKFIGKTAPKLLDKSIGFISKVANSKTATSLVSKGISLASKLANSKTATSLVSKGVSIASKIGKNVKSIATVAKTAATSMTGDAAKGIIRKGAERLVSSSGGITKLLGKVAKAPVIGPLITSAFAAYDIKQLKDEFAKGKVTKDELQEKAGRRVITGISEMVGTVGGAALVGTLASIIPVAGSALGAFAGSVGGSYLGEFLGGIITDYIVPPKYTKSIGAFVTGTEPPKDEMQDFIIKDGRIHKFSNKDELMGLKSGGAINEFLNAKPKNESYSKLVEIGLAANSYLIAIANNTAIMAKNNSNVGGNNVNIRPTIVQGGQESKSSTIIPDNRDAYQSSPYALA